jgi:hypothetical protein
VLAGDLLDKQSNNSEAIVQFTTGLRRLSSAGIRVLFVQGQHEYQKVPWASLADTHWLNDDVLEWNGWRIGGSDFKLEPEFQEFLRSHVATSSDVLVCHQVWKDFMGEIAATQGSFDQVPSNVKLLITGDFHENISMYHGEMTVLSPGSTHMRSITEPPQKMVFLIELNEDRQDMVGVSLSGLPSRQIIRIDLTEMLSTEDHGVTVEDVLGKVSDGLEDARLYAVSAELPEELAKPLLYVIHFKEDSEYANAIHRTFAERAHIFFKQVVLKSREDEVIRAAETEISLSMESYLPEFIDAEDKHAMALAAGLIRSEDPKSFLTMWLEKEF